MKLLSLRMVCPCLSMSLFLLMVLSFLGGLLVKVVEWSLSILFEVNFVFSWLTDLSFSFILDWVGGSFLVVILIISFSVMVYSSYYMNSDLNKSRFSWLVVMFVVCMVMLVLIPNFMVLMVGWDGLGLISFLLVIFYPTKESLGSGTITFIMNRIGDVMFIVGIGLSSCFLSWSFFDVEEGFNLFKMLGCLLMVGSITKSAQTPFSAWLPAAMAAPTPVSALVHSSTLVTAGVYVLIRFIGSIPSEVGFILFVMGTLTSMKGGLAAIVEVDLKKVIAMSTLSQLGFLVQCLGLGSASVCLFHLMTHALFKSLLFMCGGVLIYYNKGIQDLRFIHSSSYDFPIVGCWMLVSCFSMAGLPFLSGFFSKDLILEMMVMSGFSFLVLVSLWVPVLLTSIYSLVLLSGVLTKSSMKAVGSSELSGGLSWKINIPISTLGISSVFSGFFLGELLSEVSLFQYYLSGSAKVLFFCSPLVGTFFFLLLLEVSKFLMYDGSNFLKALGRFPIVMRLKEFLSSLWFISVLSGSVSASFFSKKMSLVGKQVEEGWVENFMGPKGLSFVGDYFYGGLKRQKVFVGKYLSLVMIFSLMCLLVIFLF